MFDNKTNDCSRKEKFFEERIAPVLPTAYIGGRLAEFEQDIRIRWLSHVWFYYDSWKLLQIWHAKFDNTNDMNNELHFKRELYWQVNVEYDRLHCER